MRSYWVFVRYYELGPDWVDISFSIKCTFSVVSQFAKPENSSGRSKMLKTVDFDSAFSFICSQISSAQTLLTAQ